jgi:hypothetical protein
VKDGGAIAWMGLDIDSQRRVPYQTRAGLGAELQLGISLRDSQTP